MSSGGPDTTREFVKSLNLRPGDRVLDLGCGIGGGDFYMVGCTSPSLPLQGRRKHFRIGQAVKIFCSLCSQIFLAPLSLARLLYVLQMLHGF